MLSTRSLDVSTVEAKTKNAVKLNDLAALLLVGLYTSVFAWLKISQQDAFKTYALDLAKFDQAIWNTAHGRFYEISLIKDLIIQGHFSPALAVYAPLYWFWPDIRVLFIAQAFFMASAGFLIYWYMRAQHPWLGLLVFAAYLINPTVHQVNLIEFRRETLAILTTSLVLYFLLKRRYRWMAASLAITFLCKEDMALTGIMVGFYLIVIQRQLRVGLAILLISVAYILIVPFVVLPALSGIDAHTYKYLGTKFGYLGQTAGEIASTLLGKPGVLLQYASQPGRLAALFNFLWPTVFLFTLAPEIAVFLAPYLAYLLTSISDRMGYLRGWYPSVLVVFLYWATAIGATRLSRRWAGPALLALFIAGFSAWGLYSQLWPGANFDGSLYQVTAHDRQVEQILSQVPANAVVVAQDALVPHLSHRQQIYLFPWYPENSSVNFFAFDRHTSLYPLQPGEYRTRFYNFLADPQFRIAAQVDGFYLFENTSPATPLGQRLDTWGGQITLLGNTVTLAGPDSVFRISDPAQADSNVLRIELVWRLEMATPNNYSITVRVLNGAEIVAQHDGWPDDAHRPTRTLFVGEIIRDTHYLSWPKTIPLSGLELGIGIYNSQNGEPLTLADGRVLRLEPLRLEP